MELLLLGTGKIYMNRILIIIIFALQACSAFDLQEYPRVAKVMLFGAQDINVSKDFYDSASYSFAHVEIGRFKKSIMILASIKDGNFLWVGPGGEQIFTRNGKIIKTYGLEYNLKKIQAKDLIFSNKSYDYASIIQLKNPDALITKRNKLTPITKETYTFNDLIQQDQAVNGFFVEYREDFKTEKLRWSGENLYWLNSDGRVVKTIQKYHPLESSVIMTFYYK